jgi:integrase
MSAMTHLQRRSSGVYFVRLVVPPWLRGVAGRAEVHRSTGCRDLELAKIVAGEIVSAWFRSLHQLRQMDINKITAGSVDLLGEGTLPLTDAAAALGSTPEQLAKRLALRKVPCFLVQAEDWSCTLVDDLTQLYDERDALGNVINLDTSPAALQLHGTPHRHTGEVLIAFNDEALALFSSDSSSPITFFRLLGQSTAGLVVERAKKVDPSRLAVRRRDVEALRFQIAELHQHALPSPAQNSKAATVEDLQALVATQDSIAKTPFAKRRLSSLVKSHLDRLEARQLKPDELRRQHDACTALVELTADMCLGDINRQVIKDAIKELAKAPNQRHLVRRKLGRPLSWREFIAEAEASNLPRLTPLALTRMTEDMASLFIHGFRQQWLKSNPMLGLPKEIFEEYGGEQKAAHELRDPFSADDLQLIFKQTWFAVGAGEKTAKGKYFSYRPYQYWLPLLGLFAGGRINELSQLHLADVRQSDTGIWHLDFNLDQPDKLEIDEDDSASSPNASIAIANPQTVGTEKSLKTSNAVRSVPLHPRLLALGLLEYVEALKRVGHKRLFPELRFDTFKGYGKEASAWFNERFLGKRLQMKRNGRKVFHSFRHNFATALDLAGTPNRAIHQMMGHLMFNKREETAPGYKHLRSLDELKPLIEALSPSLPPIAKFDIPSGLHAVNDALAYKARQPKARKQARS